MLGEVMKLWDLFYWSKHEYRWKWKGMAEGDTAYDAIRMAKACLPETVARGDMMKVVEYVNRA